MCDCACVCAWGLITKREGDIKEREREEGGRRKGGGGERESHPLADNKKLHGRLSPIYVRLRGASKA